MLITSFLDGFDMEELALYKAKALETGSWIEGQFSLNYYEVSTGKHEIVGWICGFTSFSKNLTQIPVDHETLCQFTGITLEDNKIFRGDVFRIEEPLDHGDRRSFYVIEWVKEWGIYALIHLHEEYNCFLSEGVSSLDFESFWCYTLDQLNANFKRCGNIIDTPEWRDWEFVAAMETGVLPDELKESITKCKEA